MKLLLLHVDRFEYRVLTPASTVRDDVAEDSRVFSTGEALVVFATVESRDESNIDSVVDEAVEAVCDVASRLSVDSIVLYPYAHLSSDLSSPTKAIEILDKFRSRLSSVGFKVHRAPFGWYKSFSLTVKGHPLSELSREVTGKGYARVEAERRGRFHRFLVVDIDGVVYELDPSDWRSCPIFGKPDRRYKLLEIFVRNEIEGSPGRGKPRHIEYMRRLELVDYCPESDAGHFKLYPNGVLIFDLLKDYAFFNVALPWGAVKIQNPLLYRESVKAIRDLMGEFHERDYRIPIENDVFLLRFASDPGAFPYVQKLQLTYRHMPFKIYEEVPCFRREQRGELVGLRRLRYFTMTDQHCFCRDEGEALREFENLTLMFRDLLDRIIAGGSWILGWECVEEFFEKYRDWFISLCVKVGVPSFFKLMPRMTHYYAFKNEFQVIGSDEANVQLSTVQFDVKNGERFGIVYRDSDGSVKPCIILHASSLGSLERTLYALIESALSRMDEGRLPMLPVWLSPEQIRLIPVSQKHVEFCLEIASKLESSSIRVGVDDRDLTVSRRVMEAKASWIPYIIVVGDREMETGMLPVIVREESTIDRDVIVEIKIEDLIGRVRSEFRGMPYRPLYVPKELSKRVRFVAWAPKPLKRSGGS
ncbi:MAG: threonine--tRNA ligase [Candidatus Bathyarchaeota archaeon]|nr:threonine--tRNA ligase [Candidatus Bathyarchaeota archaeon]